MAELRRIQAHAGDPVEPGLRLGQCLEGIFLVEVAQEAEDQLGADAEPRLGRLHAGEQPVGDHAERDSTMRVRLRIEEDLGMDHAVLRHPLEIGEGEVVEIFLGAQHVGAGIIDVEKVLEVRELIGGPHLLHRSEGDGDIVAAGKGEHLLGLQAALDMQMEFRLGQSGDESVEVVHRRNIAGGAGSRKGRGMALPPCLTGASAPRSPSGRPGPDPRHRREARRARDHHSPNGATHWATCRIPR